MKETDINRGDKNTQSTKHFDYGSKEGNDLSGISYSGGRIRKRKQNILKDTIIQFVFFALTIIWVEIVYHITVFHHISIAIFLPIVFSLALAAVFTLLTGFFHEKVNRILLWLLTALICILYTTELVYISIFKQPLFLYAAGAGAGQITAYWKEALLGVVKNLPSILLIFLPMAVLFFIVKKYLSMRRRALPFQIVVLITGILLYIIPVFSLSIGGKSDGTVYATYHNFTDVNKAIKDLGVFTALRLDASKIFIPGTTDQEIQNGLVIANSPIPSGDSQAVDNPENTPVATIAPTEEPILQNVMSIDFESLATNETKKTIKSMHEYFASLTPSNKNEYTGMFKGYNLILITAEAFSPYCIDEELTPTLYKLTHEGFQFNNFYTPLWQTSTSDGEFVATTGLLPDQQFSMRRSEKNDLPFTMGNQFNRLGVESKAYHNNSLSYYDRYKTHTNLGYKFKAANLGKLSEKEYGDWIFPMENPKAWPQSDLEMMQSTVPEYMNEDQFNVYYMTVSGHMNYSFDGNAMSAKNKEAVKNLPYSASAKAYIACNIELDKALESLITQLETTGVLDKTVICMSGDHYPYGLDKSAIDEIAGHKVDENFEIYKSNLVMWNSAIKQPIVVEKPACSLDIIPTLSNLFGLTYDSRLLLGSDILSDSDPLVILANRSFITDKVMYNSATKKATNLTEEEVSDDYIKNISQIVKNKFIISAGIIDNDYYSKIEEQLKFDE